MPSYDCPDCGRSFDSREARQQHREDVHSSDGVAPFVQRMQDVFTSKRKLAALVFGIIMVGLPLGGVMFYSSLAPSGSSSTPSGTDSGYRQTPPVGYGITSVPQPDSVPEETILEEELTPDQQVYLLLEGGPRQAQGGVKPAVLVQYSCTDCQQTVQQLESFVQEFNGGQSWVYLAPNTRMNQTIALTAYRSSEFLDTVDEQAMQEFICERTSNQPVACIEGSFS